MASNYPTFGLGLFDDIQELDIVSEMVETSETSDKSKDQQLSESATGCYRLHLEHLLRYLRAFPTIRMHPELDGRSLGIVHSLNIFVFMMCYSAYKL